MRYIKLFEDYSDSILENLFNTLKKSMDDSYDCEMNIEDDKIIIKNDKYTISVKDNGNSDDFYLIDIEDKEGNVRLKSEEGDKEFNSPDQVPSDDVLLFVSQYFQKVN